MQGSGLWARPEIIEDQEGEEAWWRVASTASADMPLSFWLIGFLVVDGVLMAWGRAVDARGLLRGLLRAKPFSAREFFGQRCVFFIVAVSVMLPFFGPWAASLLGLSIALLGLLLGLRLQAQAERSGLAAEERRQHDLYKERLQAMSPGRRLAWRTGVALTVAVVAGLFAALRRFGT